MKVSDIMTLDPVSCTPDASLQEVAELMAQHDCGEIPVIEDEQGLQPIGVVTDRDIVIRAVAQGISPAEMAAQDCMSTPCITVDSHAGVDDARQVLEDHQLRRLPVVDEHGALCGMVSQADFALHASQQEAGEMLREISRPG